jgi:hypothetical protein
MSTLERIAYFQGRRDEVPNQELARALARTQDSDGIAEIAANLRHATPAIQSDCVKVLYEIGYLRPDLIAPYVSEFLRLLDVSNNRMVWGGMIALATISAHRPTEIWAQIDKVMTAVERGTLITVVWGVRALAGVARALPISRTRILPVLAAQLETCSPRDLPMHAESVLPAMDETSRGTFVAILAERTPELTQAPARRLRAVLRQLGQPG